MVSRSLNRSQLPAKAAAIAAICLFTAASVDAQSARFAVDSRSSLAWWQLNPHLNHLWATTCPEEPSWQPGQDRSAGWTIKESKLPKNGYANTIEKKVPLFPRDTVHAVCPSQAIEGEIAANDTTSWRGVNGVVSVRAEALITGLKMRDDFASKAVLHSNKYPEIRFRIDSLISVQRGDTTRANAVGVLELHGVQNPMTVPLKIWRDGGGLRVTGQFEFAAHELVEKYRMSRMALGLGVGTGIWKKLHMGVDVVLKPAAAGRSSQNE
jgi:YceI-like protein